ncbi:sulfotransferase [Faunimonas sp. B44]|uniref:sulfotransferase n=1 Tax=Faunimonas sp. B44 TaxID=3461493 RepID=UPI004043D243
MKGPVFVLGPGRSGTSVLYSALKVVTGAAGYGEGFFFPLALELSNLVQAYFRKTAAWQQNPKLLIHHVEQSRVRSGVLHAIKEEMERVHGGVRFIEKTPLPVSIASAPLALELWPDAKFVFATRRAIENVASRMRKFPQLSFDKHCEHWAASMTMWESVRPKLGDSFVEVDQIDISRQPDFVANAISTLIGLSRSEEAAISDYFKKHEPQSTQEPGRPHDIMTIDSAPFDEQQRAILLARCGELMDRFGYSLDEGYWRLPDERQRSSV